MEQLFDTLRRLRLLRAREEAGIEHVFDLLPEGAAGWKPKLRYA